MTTAVELLTEARALITEKGWTQSAFARDKEGRPTGFTDPDATCFCLDGAVLLAARKFGKEPLLPAEECIIKAIGLTGYPWTSYIQWNDQPTREKEEVVEMLDKAIALAKAQYPA